MAEIRSDLSQTRPGSASLWRRRARRGIIAATLLLYAACTTAPSQTNVASFAAAVGTTTASLRNGYQAAQNVEIIENRVVVTTAALCRITTCPAVTTLSPKPPVLTDVLLEQQYQVLSGLNAYADLLTSLTSTQTQTLVSQSVNNVGTSLRALSGELDKTSGGKLSLDAATVAQGTRAVGALGDFLVQEKINAELPKVIDQNQAIIVNIANYLDATIGTPADTKDKDGKDVPAHGIRAIVALQQRAIDQNGTVLLNRLRRNQSIKDTDLIDYTRKIYDGDLSLAQKTDAALVDVQAAIKKMVTAHAALRAPSDPTTFQQVQSFVAFAQRAAAAIDRALGKSQ
jgi:hypothetical protein